MKLKFTIKNENIRNKFHNYISELRKSRKEVDPLSPGVLESRSRAAYVNYLKSDKIVLNFYCVGFKAKILEEFIGGYVFMMLREKRPEEADGAKLRSLICK